jgi:hypothetical protein
MSQDGGVGDPIPSSGTIIPVALHTGLRHKSGTFRIVDHKVLLHIENEFPEVSTRPEYRVTAMCCDIAQPSKCQVEQQLWLALYLVVSSIRYVTPCKSQTERISFNSNFNFSKASISISISTSISIMVKHQLGLSTIEFQLVCLHHYLRYFCPNVIFPT